jgi:hypothetical protein
MMHLPPLEFSDLEQCIECIKGKFVKKIKRNAKRSTSVLEIIHTDICGPFNVKSVDGYDSFIIFTDDYSCYGYIYPIKERSEAFLSSHFEMKALGEARFILGIEIHRDRVKGVLGLSQKTYIEKVLKKFSMHKCSASPVRPEATGLDA